MMPQDIAACVMLSRSDRYALDRRQLRVSVGQEGLSASYRRYRRHTTCRGAAQARTRHTPVQLQQAIAATEQARREPHVAAEVETYRPFSSL